MDRIAVIKIRGEIRAKREVKDTLIMLNLKKKNSCIILPKNNIGMLAVIKDYVTWGEINKETLEQLFKARAKIKGNKPLTEEYLKKNKLELNKIIDDLLNSKLELKNIKDLKPYFRLKPPSKGFERKGIKKPFSLGGALGYRKDAINNLIKKML